MNELGAAKQNQLDLASIGLRNPSRIYWNESVINLVDMTLKREQGRLSDSNALAVDTGEFTGRSPKDKYIVHDAQTENTVWWGEVNHPIDTAHYNSIYADVMKYLENREVFVRDMFACASVRHRLSIRVITEYPWQNIFVNNLFIQPNNEQLQSFDPSWSIIAVPGFKANPAIHQTRQHNFTVINFSTKVILIGGTGYTGEIKKGVFTVLGYLLPLEKNVLTMHCSANYGKHHDTALFFGLSGTGKTTLSADSKRNLIGDDEHAWSDNAVFNIEGGCYAKCVNLSKEQEPQIYKAIRSGTLLENVSFFENTNTVNYYDITKTENTRAAYPISFIENAAPFSIADTPKNIFFLTCDAFGVLPPISKLSIGQAMYHFISGYTAKVAGTEAGINEPQTTFSACFGRPFLPLRPTRYAAMLGEKLKKGNINVWLINTGWSGGPYGTGERIKLQYTRAMITAALDGSLDKVRYEKHPVFKLKMPTICPQVPDVILNPKNTWNDPSEYDKTANKLAAEFIANFKHYETFATPEMIADAPACGHPHSPEETSK